MINESEYLDLKKKYEIYHKARKELCGKSNCVTAEQSKLLPNSCTNEEISAIEIYEFVNNPPEKYFLYVDEHKGIVTTWIGEKLGTCQLGRKYKNNMGDIRQSIWVRAINGRDYVGTYFQSSGDYARIKICKA